MRPKEDGNKRWKKVKGDGIGLLAVVVFFTALRGMQTRSSDENSVRPSVICLSARPSVKRVHYYKTEKDMFRFLYHTKDYLA